LGTSYKLAPAGFTLKTLTNSESLPKGVAHGCDRGDWGTSCKLAPAEYDDWLNDLDFPKKSKYGAQYLNSLGW